MNALRRSLLLAAGCGALAVLFSGCAAVMVGAASGTAGAVVASDSRTVNTMMYDETIEQEGNEVLYSNKLLSGKEDFKVSIYSMSGNVLLTGQTTNQDYLNWCISQIRTHDYVRQIYNYVTNQKPVSMSVQASDAYITSALRSKLLFGKGISSSRFKVVTENGEVFLMGFVNPDEAKRAVNLAASTDGVRKVYTIFDYMTNEAILTEKPQSSESLNVRRVDVNTGAATAPVYNTPAANNSTYITPVDQSANGGAAIVGSDADLLAPSAPAEIY